MVSCRFHAMPTDTYDYIYCVCVYLCGPTIEIRIHSRLLLSLTWFHYAIRLTETHSHAIAENSTSTHKICYCWGSETVLQADRIQRKWYYGWSFMLSLVVDSEVNFSGYAYTPWNDRRFSSFSNINLYAMPDQCLHRFFANSNFLSLLFVQRLLFIFFCLHTLFGWFPDEWIDTMECPSEVSLQIDRKPFG